MAFQTLIIYIFLIWIIEQACDVVSVQPDTIAAGVRVVLLKDMKQGQSQPTCDAVGAGLRRWWGGCRLKRHLISVQ